jgi:AhpD family alkylhydroperoxidase
MSRLSLADASTTDPERIQARNELKAAWRGVPNLGEVVALSLPLTRALIAYDRHLAEGSFTRPVSELVAIAVAHENRCSYCLAAHTAGAMAAGVPAQDAADARTGHASDPKVQAALVFAQQAVRERGHITDEQLAAVREAGYGDGEIVELVGHAIATTLTNYLHHLSGVPVEFPAVEFAPAEATPQAR